jgi:hypothetical protein
MVLCVSLTHRLSCSRTSHTLQTSTGQRVLALDGFSTNSESEVDGYDIHLLLLLLLLLDQCGSSMFDGAGLLDLVQAYYAACPRTWRLYTCGTCDSVRRVITRLRLAVFFFASGHRYARSPGADASLSGHMSSLSALSPMMLTTPMHGNRGHHGREGASDYERIVSGT